MKPLRFIFALAFVVASIWIGAFIKSDLPHFHWAGFPTILTACVVAACGAVLIGAGLIDAPLRVVHAAIERVRRALMQILFGTASGGPYRVISLRSGNEVARFICADDALAWAVYRQRVEGPHGPLYEVRNVYGDRVTNTPKCPDCDGAGKVPLNRLQTTTCVRCDGVGSLKSSDTPSPQVNKMMGMR